MFVLPCEQIQRQRKEEQLCIDSRLFFVIHRIIPLSSLSLSLSRSLFAGNSGKEHRMSGTNAIQAHLYTSRVINYYLLLIPDVCHLCYVWKRQQEGGFLFSLALSHSHSSPFLSLISFTHSPPWQHSTPSWPVYLAGQDRTG